MEELKITVLEKHLRGVEKELEVGLEYARQSLENYLDKYGTHRRIHQLAVECIEKDIDNIKNTLSWVKAYLGEEDDYVD